MRLLFFRTYPLSFLVILFNTLTILHWLFIAPIPKIYLIFISYSKYYPYCYNKLKLEINQTNKLMKLQQIWMNLVSLISLIPALVALFILGWAILVAFIHSLKWISIHSWMIRMKAAGQANPTKNGEVNYQKLLIIAVERRLIWTWLIRLSKLVVFILIN